MSMLSGFVGSVLALLLAVSPVVPAFSSISVAGQLGAAAAGADKDAFATRCEKGHVYVLVIGADGGMSVTDSRVSDPSAIPVVSIITKYDGKVKRKICTMGLVVDTAPESSRPQFDFAASPGQNIFEPGETVQNRGYLPALGSYLEYMQCAFGYGDCSAPTGSKVSNNGERTTASQSIVVESSTNDSDIPPAILISGDSVGLEAPKNDTQGKILTTKEIGQSQTTFWNADPPSVSPAESEPGWLDWRRILSVPGVIVCFLIPSDCKAYQYVKDRKKPAQQ